MRNYALRYFYKGYSLRGNPPPFRPNNIRTKTAIPKYLFCYNSPQEEWSTGCNIVVSLAIHFAILLIAPRAYCSLHHPPDALTNAHPPYPQADRDDRNCTKFTPCEAQFRISNSAFRIKNALAFARAFFLNPTQRRV